ncbi:MAG: nucleotidyltransferase domain-containing protein [Candidatus Bathyarchaeia archaeon]
MASLRLRDRDAIVTHEGLIFRVFGYTHPPDAYICDLEYAPAKLFRSSNPKAPRLGGYVKFYEDEAWHFIQTSFPQYLIPHKPLGRRVLGVRHCDIAGVRRPQEALKKLLEKPAQDPLVEALRRVLEATVFATGLSVEDFGVFGSLLHDFYHPLFSDIDIIVYGRENLEQIRRRLQELYADEASGFSNEFETDAPVMGKLWRYKNLSPEEFVWHQRRKLIYGVFRDEASERAIKVEFEPVKAWSETRNEYGEIRKITREGWVKALLMVKDDSEAPFMPSIYLVESIDILEGPKVGDIERIVSYIEEFRMQAWKDEVVYVEGNLEKVETSRGSFHQITLTYGPKYYNQVIKIANPQLLTSNPLP